MEPRADETRLPTRLRARALGAALLLAGLAAARVAGADPLPTSDYAIDVYQGPLLTPIRITSLGGAYAGYGEGIPGLVSNAAAPAVRELFSTEHVEFAMSGSFSFPLGIAKNNDFDNDGNTDADYSSFIYANGGMLLQVGAFGAGLVAELQTYTLTNGNEPSTQIVLGRYHALTGVGFARGDLVIGGGARAVTLGLFPGDRALAYAGIGPELGILVKPSVLPFRFGGTFRFPVSAAPTFDSPATDALGRMRLGALVLPRRAVEPWELEIGTAVQFGPRALNMPFDDPEDLDDGVEREVERAREQRARIRERALDQITEPSEHDALELRLDEEERAYREVEVDAAESVERKTEDLAEARAEGLPRPRLLLLLSVLTTGAVDDGVSLEGFLGQQTSAKARDVIGSAGADINFSPRFGVEVEVVPKLLVLRGGGYYEPSRFGTVGRQHGTTGLALKVLRTDLFGILPELDWGIELGGDLAPRYQSLSASIAVFR